MPLFGKLFKKKEIELEPCDLSVLGTDVHSHFIPGIDDGAKNMENALEMIRAMSSFGYKKVITTPHVMSDFYRNSPEIILGGLAKLKEAVINDNIPIDIEAAAEYNLDADFEPKIKSKELLTFGENYVLFELPFIMEPPNLARAIFEMQMNDYKPVLAHAERYPFWFQDFQKIIDLKDRGVFIQLNINSLTGFYGPEVRGAGEKLIDEGIVDLLGSDCHHMGHIEMMETARTRPYLHTAIELPNLINKEL
jgi:tyrosine-protein phosphatase YwqE